MEQSELHTILPSFGNRPANPILDLGPAVCKSLAEQVVETIRPDCLYGLQIALPSAHSSCSQYQLQPLLIPAQCLIGLVTLGDVLIEGAEAVKRASSDIIKPEIILSLVEKQLILKVNEVMKMYEKD